MERLTKRNDTDNGYYYPYCFREDTCDGEGMGDCDECEMNTKISDKLGAYEDTGLEPEQIYQLDKMYRQLCEELAEYKKLKQKGLLLQLPCKVGDTVYEILFNYKKEPYKVIKVPVRTLTYVVGLMEDKDWGRTVFLSKSEAQEALKRLEREQNEEHNA